MPTAQQDFRFVAQYFDAEDNLVAEDDVVVKCNDWEHAMETAESRAQANLDEYSAEYYNIA